MAALLEASELEAFYGPTSVLHGLSFSIQAGGITTILGANGAGKTTTLRAVCGMIRTEGEVRFAGTRIDGMTTEDIVIGIACSRWPRYLRQPHRPGEFAARRLCRTRQARRARGFDPFTAISPSSPRATIFGWTLFSAVSSGC
jgi:ABC-type branched-subunit amino acid transport system ATPase component